MAAIKSRKRQRSARSKLVPGLVTGLLVASFLSFYVSKVHISYQERLLHDQGGIVSNPVSHSLGGYRVTSENKKVETEEGSTATTISKEELIRKLYPIETAIENPPLSDGESTFAACMLVMDDNMRLTEWCKFTV